MIRPDAPTPARAPRRGQRATGQDKPALVDTPAPAPAADAEVLPPEAPTAPAVSSTEPLPSDQATAPERPIDTAAATTEPAPAVVPEHVPAADLVPPAEPASGEPADVVMERVPSTVPLPSDQITPEVPRPAGSFFDAFRGELARLTPQERAAILADLVGDDVAPRSPVDEGMGGIRLFPAAYEIDHDGRLYRPGGELLALTFAEHARLFRTTAVQVAWDAGEVPEA